MHEKYPSTIKKYFTLTKIAYKFLEKRKIKFKMVEKENIPKE